MPTLTTNQHIEAVISYLNHCLDIAEKRTAGEWRHATYAKPENFNELAERTDQIIASECRESDPVLFETWNGDDDDIGNIAFISACSVSAEAGWRATIVAIKGLRDIIAKDAEALEGLRDLGSSITIDDLPSAQLPINVINSILSNFPVEMLTGGKER